MTDAVALPPEMTRATRADWDAAVAKVLKGADPARLATTTRDGLVLQPLGVAPEGLRPLPSWRAPGPWSVVARIDLPDAGQANAQIIADLAGGADALALVFAGSPEARGFGLAEDVDFRALFEGVATDGITIRVEAGAATAAVAARLKTALPGATVIAADDPVARALVAGAALPAARPDDAVDGRFVHAAGGSEGQELAYMLAALVRVWRARVAAGQEIGAALAGIPVTLAADQEQFATLAKLRAARRLIGLLAEEAGVAAAPRLHAETAWRMVAGLDVHSNLLRAAIATFAAGVGGADSVAVLPFTAALGLADGFARRLARNTQRVILDEAQVWRVADIGAGAGAVEAETSALAEAAWTRFTAMEQVGGIEAAAGALAADIAKTAMERARDIARRRTVLTGVSEFAQLDAEAPHVLAAAPQAGAAGPLAPHRLAEPFERLRARAAAAAPTAFLATLGAPADFTARATWTKNLLEAGGIAAPFDGGFDSAIAVAAAFRASEAPLAVVASSDAVYGALLLPVVEALVAAGARRVWVAGKPHDDGLETLLRAAGVDGFLAAGQDVVSTLTAIQTSLGLEG